MKNIISWSGGKDSTATVILAHEHNIPVDKIVMAHLWFDKSRGISAVPPPHWEFVTQVAVPKFEEWGYTVEFVEGAFDYVQHFFKPITRSKVPGRNGRIGGFPMAMRCWMTGAKQQALGRIQKMMDGAVSIQGIAIDEPERLARMHQRPNTWSLLEEYGFDEAMAKAKCEEYGLLSPIYTGEISRDGCWFCPNQSVKQLAVLRRNHPELWAELKTLAAYGPQMVSPNFHFNLTLADLERKMDWYEYQHSFCQQALWDLYENL